MRTLDAYADMKARGDGRPDPAAIRDIHMPSNTCAGLVIGIFSLVLGFALVWHIWWLAIAGLVGIVATLVIYSSRDNDGYYIPASTVRKIEEKQSTKRVTARVDDVELEAN